LAELLPEGVRAEFEAAHADALRQADRAAARLRDRVSE
jgi:hypothetical protein